MAWFLYGATVMWRQTVGGMWYMTRVFHWSSSDTKGRDTFDPPILYPGYVWRLLRLICASCITPETLNIPVNYETIEQLRVLTILSRSVVTYESMDKINLLSLSCKTTYAMNGAKIRVSAVRRQTTILLFLSITAFKTLTVICVRTCRIILRWYAKSINTEIKIIIQPTQEYTATQKRYRGTPPPPQPSIHPYYIQAMCDGCWGWYAPVVSPPRRPMSRLIMKQLGFRWNIPYVLRKLFFTDFFFVELSSQLFFGIRVSVGFNFCVCVAK